MCLYSSKNMFKVSYNPVLKKKLFDWSTSRILWRKTDICKIYMFVLKYTIAKRIALNSHVFVFPQL